MFRERLGLLHELILRCEHTTSHGAVVAEEALKMVHFLIAQVAKINGIVYFIGNGGSAALASHFSTDFLRTLGVGAATMSDSATLTCLGNDFGYESVYRIPCEMNLKPNDLLIAISSSGASSNILSAAEIAKQKKIGLITFSGFAADNPLRTMGDLNFWLDSSDYGLVETGHFFQLHTIVDTFTPQPVLKQKDATQDVEARSHADF